MSIEFRIISAGRNGEKQRSAMELMVGAATDLVDCVATGRMVPNQTIAVRSRGKTTGRWRGLEKLRWEGFGGEDGWRFRRLEQNKFLVIESIFLKDIFFHF